MDDFYVHVLEGIYNSFQAMRRLIDYFKTESSVPVHASPSEVYLAGKLHQNFACGFDFRVLFAADLSVSKGLSNIPLMQMLPARIIVP